LPKKEKRAGDARKGKKSCTKAEMMDEQQGEAKQCVRMRVSEQTNKQQASKEMRNLSHDPLKVAKQKPKVKKQQSESAAYMPCAFWYATRRQTIRKYDVSHSIGECRNRFGRRGVS